MDSWRSHPDVRPDARPDARPDRTVLLARLFDACDDLAMVPDRFASVLGYDEAFAWFVDARPSGGGAHRGAILRSPATEGRVEIIQLFLTEHNEVLCDGRGRPMGRRLIVDGLEDELAVAFGTSDLVIVG